MTDEDGQIIIGIDTNDTAGRPSGKFIPLNGEEFRRSIYVQMRRKTPLTVLDTFDEPTMSPNCETRNCTTVAPQSLLMMNDSFVLDASHALARRPRSWRPPALLPSARDKALLSTPPRAIRTATNAS